MRPGQGGGAGNAKRNICRQQGETEGSNREKKKKRCKKENMAQGGRKQGRMREQEKRVRKAFPLGPSKGRGRQDMEHGHDNP